MRTKIIIGFSFLLLAFALVLSRSASSSPAVSLRFTGYSEDGRTATFVLANHTSRYLDHSHPRIQFQTPAGWTNYYDPVEMAMCRLLGPLPDRQTAALSATLPAGQRHWRASVHYRVMPSDETGWRRPVAWLREFVQTSPSTNESTIVTEEFFR